MRQRCRNCIFFVRIRYGLRGGIKGNCRIRRPNEERRGSTNACRMFKENHEN